MLSIVFKNKQNKDVETFVPASKPNGTDLKVDLFMYFLLFFLAFYIFNTKIFKITNCVLIFLKYYNTNVILEIRFFQKLGVINNHVLRFFFCFVLQK